MSNEIISPSEMPVEAFAPALAEAVSPAMARIYGQPMDQMPLDLYIPPDALAVMLDAFEGPLDLLLYLIRKANIDILDIPMAPLTVQYLAYVEAMRSTNLELASDYLVMAATLIEIKSRMLLPRPKVAGEEEVEDPRAELVRRLVEYEQMKAAGQRIDALPQADRDYEWVSVLAEKSAELRFPEVDVDDLQKAWQTILRQARLHKHHKLQREELSVREHMTGILRLLRDADARGVTFVEFVSLFEPAVGVGGVVVHFLAMLELAREQLINLSQTEAFAPIYVRLAFAVVHDDSAEGVAQAASVPTYADMAPDLPKPSDHHADNA
jgi:segregation and condensation protein A